VFGSQLIIDPKGAPGVYVAPAAATKGRKMLGESKAVVHGLHGHGEEAKAEEPKDDKTATVYWEQIYAVTKLPNVEPEERPCYATEAGCPPRSPSPSPSPTPTPSPKVLPPGWLGGATPLKFAITSYPTIPVPTPTPPQPSV
jgi:hypothetical protein